LLIAIEEVFFMPAGKRTTLTLPMWIYMAVDAHAVEYGLSFSRALSDLIAPVLARPDKSAKETDPLAILANTPFPPNPSGDTLAPPEERQEYWVKIRDIYRARRALGITSSRVDYEQYAKLEKAAKAGAL
jgi:hypothetical protein